MSTACKKWITSSRKLEIQAVIVHQSSLDHTVFQSFPAYSLNRMGSAVMGVSRMRISRMGIARVRVVWFAGMRIIRMWSIRMRSARMRSARMLFIGLHTTDTNTNRVDIVRSVALVPKNTHKHCLLPLESKICNIYDMFRNWGRSHQRSAHLPHTLPWWRTPGDSCLWQHTPPCAEVHLEKTTYHLPLTATLLHWWPSDLVAADCSSAMHSASTHWPSW